MTFIAEVMFLATAVHVIDRGTWTTAAHAAPIPVEAGKATSRTKEIFFSSGCHVGTSPM